VRPETLIRGVEGAMEWGERGKFAKKSPKKLDKTMQRGKNAYY
jgi:hypothetical protein